MTEPQNASRNYDEIKKTVFLKYAAFLRHDTNFRKTNLYDKLRMEILFYNEMSVKYSKELQNIPGVSSKCVT